MVEIPLPKSGGTAISKVLGLEHLSDVLALQEEARASLPDDQKMFVLPQTNSYFEKLLRRETGLMVGLYAGHDLVAQMALMGPMTLDEAIERNAITRGDVSFHHADPSETVVVAKSMSVRPQWVGNGLSQHLLQAAMEQGTARIADHVFAQISVANTRSWELFLRQGFAIVAAATDPIDGQPRFVLQKPALGFSLHEHATVDDLDGSRDFTHILRLTQFEALIGHLSAFGTRAGNLAFSARLDLAASWYDSVPASS